MDHKPLVREYLEALIIAVIFATFARAFVLQAFKIPTSSMEENLLVGDHVLVNKFVYGPTGLPFEHWVLPMRQVRRGDVVVFKFPQDPTRDFIKRCVGLPGDTVRIVDKQLQVNGETVEDAAYTYRDDPRTYPRSLLVSDNFRLRDNYGPYTVPEAHLFCLGDNRDNSNDSRFWGPVPQENVRGRAFMIYWSFDSAAGGPGAQADQGSGEGEGSGLLGWLARARWVLAHFSSHTRWERTFQIVR